MRNALCSSEIVCRWFMPFEVVAVTMQWAQVWIGCIDWQSHPTGYPFNQTRINQSSNKSTTMLRLRQVLVLTRDLARTKEFYAKGLQLPLMRASESFAEFDTKAGVALCVRQAENEAACSSGYSPFLNFDVHDLGELVPRLLQLGATLDGPIKYPAHGKVAAVRAPDGIMIGLYEPNTWDTVTSA